MRRMTSAKDSTTKRGRGRPKKEGAVLVPDTPDRPLLEAPRYQRLSSSEQSEARDIWSGMREYTRGELSDLEYVNLTFLQMTVDRINKAIDFEPGQVDANLLKEMRQYVETINKAVGDWRKERAETVSNIGALKNKILTVVKDKGKTVLTIEDGGPVIDVLAEVTEVR